MRKVHFKDRNLIVISDDIIVQNTFYFIFWCLVHSVSHHCHRLGVVVSVGGWGGGRGRQMLHTSSHESSIERRRPGGGLTIKTGNNNECDKIEGGRRDLHMVSTPDPPPPRPLFSTTWFASIYVSFSLIRGKKTTSIWKLYQAARQAKAISLVDLSFISACAKKELIFFSFFFCSRRRVVSITELVHYVQIKSLVRVFGRYWLQSALRGRFPGYVIITPTHPPPSLLMCACIMVAFSWMCLVFYYNILFSFRNCEIKGTTGCELFSLKTTGIKRSTSQQPLIENFTRYLTICVNFADREMHWKST